MASATAKIAAKYDKEIPNRPYFPRRIASLEHVPYKVTNLPYELF